LERCTWKSAYAQQLRTPILTESHRGVVNRSPNQHTSRITYVHNRLKTSNDSARPIHHHFGGHFKQHQTRQGASTLRFGISRAPAMAPIFAHRRIQNASTRPRGNADYSVHFPTAILLASARNICDDGFCEPRQKRRSEMKTYDSQNRLMGEINTTFLQDGTVVTRTLSTTRTAVRPSLKHSVRNSQGKITTRDHLAESCCRKRAHALLCYNSLAHLTRHFAKRRHPYCPEHQHELMR